MDTISFVDFAKLELVLARIVLVEAVEGSEKLLRLMLDIGESEQRQIVAGIGKQYSPDDLVGRDIVIVKNLEPRKLMGLVSEGMLLAASDENGFPIILCPDKEAKPGSKIT